MCRISQVEDIDHIGTSFAVETNRRDEDADMYYDAVAFINYTASFITFSFCELCVFSVMVPELLQYLLVISTTVFIVLLLSEFPQFIS